MEIPEIGIRQINIPEVYIPETYNPNTVLPVITNLEINTDGWKYKNRDIVLLEVGVSNGGSINMWSSYFGKNSKIYGIDIDPRCKEFEDKNIEIFIGSQSEKNFLELTLEEQLNIICKIIKDFYNLIKKILSN